METYQKGKVAFQQVCVFFHWVGGESKLLA